MDDWLKDLIGLLLVNAGNKHEKKLEEKRTEKRRGEARREERRRERRG
jgi:hypothetical protein